jgi:hypothetical protein
MLPKLQKKTQVYHGGEPKPCGPLFELLLDLLVRRITQMHAGSGLAVQPSSGQYCSLKEFEVAVRNHESKPGRADPEAAEGKRMRVSPIPFT